MFLTTQNRIDRRATGLFLFGLIWPLIIWLVWLSLVNSYVRPGLDTIVNFPVFGPDSLEYFQIAESFLTNAQMSISTDRPPVPISFRTPGYPLFVAVVWNVFGNLIFVSFVQIILSATTAVLIYKTAKLYLPDKYAGAIGFLTIVELSAAYYSTILLTDTLFTFLLVFCTYLFCRTILDSSLTAWSKNSNFFLIGLLLGSLTLVRPIGQFLPLLFIPAVIVGGWKSGLRKSIIFALILMTGFGLVVGPWLLRNRFIFAEWSVSSVAAYSLYHYNAPMFYAYRRGVTIDRGREYFRNKIGLAQDSLRLRSLHEAKQLKRVALDYLKNDLSGYARFHAVKVIPFFLTDGLRDMASQLELIFDPLPNLSNYLLKLDLLGLWLAIFTSPVSAALFFIGTGFWLVINVVALVGLGYCWRWEGGRRFVTVFSFLLIIYFAFLTGPVANARFRLPVQPFMFLMAGLGLYGLRSRTIS